MKVRPIIGSHRIAKGSAELGGRAYLSLMPLSYDTVTVPPAPPELQAELAECRARADALMPEVAAVVSSYQRAVDRYAEDLDAAVSGSLSKWRFWAFADQFGPWSAASGARALRDAIGQIAALTATVDEPAA